jgi:hypothetical protein
VPFTKALLPTAEIDYLLEHDLPSPILHEAFIGPYLVYRFAGADGSPLRLAAITPRSRLLAPAQALAESAIEKMQPGWKEFFTFIAPETILCRTHTPLYYQLERDPDWNGVVAYGRELPSAVVEKKLERGVFGWAVFVKADSGSLELAKSLL